MILILRIADFGLRNENTRGDVDRHIEQIKAIIAEVGKRYQSKGGDVQLAGIEGGTVKISPAGFCWR